MRTLILFCALVIASSAHAQYAADDTLDLYGGPGTLEGKFQTAAGEPDSQGWVGVDESAPESDDRWSISTYQAANLDTTVAGNRAWWCGRDIPSCDGVIDPDGGYGNGWNTALATSRTVDPTLAATMTLHGIFNSYTEPGYDYVHVEVVTAAGNVRLIQFDGIHTGEVLDLAYDWQPGDYVGPDGDEVRIQLRFSSDEGWSDEDCSYPTSGALQVDNLQLVIEQTGLPVDTGPVETCEPGDDVNWEVVPLPGAGNFAQLWSGLDDLDPDLDNHSPQWAFLDDGLVVPGVGPTYCWTKCYGPDSLVVNHDSRGLTAFANSIMSPPIALPDGWDGTLHLAYDAYIDPAMCFSVLVTWGMLATDDPAGLEGWVETWDPFVYIRSGTYGRYEFPVKDDMIPTSSRHVRIKLKAVQVGPYCWGPMDSPAPYLDNVRLQLGPKIVSDVPVVTGVLEATAAPNPFNPAVLIRWNLPRAGDLAVRIHDARGRLVRTLRTGHADAGWADLTWHGRDDTGQSVAAGVYFCRLESVAGARTLKLTLLK